MYISIVTEATHEFRTIRSPPGSCPAHPGDRRERPFPPAVAVVAGHRSRGRAAAQRTPARRFARGVALDGGRRGRVDLEPFDGETRLRRMESAGPGRRPALLLSAGGGAVGDRPGALAGGPAPNAAGLLAGDEPGVALSRGRRRGRLARSTR